jgi:hypothetical protein
MALLPLEVLGFHASGLSRQNFYGWTAVFQDRGAHILVPRYLATKLHGVLYQKTANLNSYQLEEKKIRCIKASTFDWNRTPSSSAQPVTVLHDCKCNIETKVNDLSLNFRELQKEEKREHS